MQVIELQGAVVGWYGAYWAGESPGSPRPVVCVSVESASGETVSRPVPAIELPTEPSRVVAGSECHVEDGDAIETRSGHPAVLLAIGAPVRAERASFGFRFVTTALVYRRAANCIGWLNHPRAG